MTIVRLQVDTFAPRLTFPFMCQRTGGRRTAPELQERQLEIDVELGGEGRFAAGKHSLAGVVNIRADEKRNNRCKCP